MTPEFKVRMGKVVINSIWDKTPTEHVHILEGDMRSKYAEAWLIDDHIISLEYTIRTQNLDESADRETTLIEFTPDWHVIYAMIGRYTFRAVVVSKDFFETQLTRSNHRDWKDLWFREEDEPEESSTDSSGDS